MRILSNKKAAQNFFLNNKVQEFGYKKKFKKKRI